MLNDILIPDIEIVTGDWVSKPRNISSPWSCKILFTNPDIDSHFLDKDSKFGDKNKDYLRINIFCKDIEAGLIEKDKILERYKYLSPLYVQLIGKKGQDWRSNFWKYGNCIEIVFIP